MQTFGMMEDALLIDEFLKGNLKSFEVLYKKYYKVLVVYAKQYVNDLQIAQDLTQDTFITIYEKRDHLEIHTSFKSFMYTAVRNKCLNYLKRENKVVDQSFLKEQITSEQEDISTITNVELAEKLYAAIDQLPSQNKAIFKMSRYRGLTNEEIAQQLNLTKRTVETHISNALKKLRATLLIGVLFFIHISVFHYVFHHLNLSYIK